MGKNGLMQTGAAGVNAGGKVAPALPDNGRGGDHLLDFGLAHAQGIGDPADGQRIAASTCSSCHQINVQRRDSTNDPVPSFQAIAAMPSTTMLSINVFLRTSHNVMPNIRLSETQITDIGAYILSLRDQSPK